MVVIRQAWLLTVKNLRILWMRRIFTTVFCTLLFPVVLILFSAYTRYLTTPFSPHGISTAVPLRSLEQAMKVTTGGRNTIAFVNGGHSRGAIDQVIDIVASPIRSLEKKVELLSDEADIGNVCRPTLRGTTSCYGAVVFFSSPGEGPGGVWNYTLRSDNSFGARADVTRHNNDAEIYLLPLQHSIDAAIASLNMSAERTFPSIVKSLLYTSLTEAENNEFIRVDYMDTITNILAIAFLISMAPISFHVAGFVTAERESGISQLIEAMLPGQKRWKPTLARILSYHWAFSASYLPGWIVISIILYCSVFTRTSFAILLALHLLSGPALISFSILSATLFKKAYMSGICATLALVVFATIAQTEQNSSTAEILVLSCLFTPVAYISFVNEMAHFESKKSGINLLHEAPGAAYKVPGIAFLAFIVLQLLAYPVFAFFIERWLYGTISPKRHIIEGNRTKETVRLKNFSKVYAANGCKRRILRLFGRRHDPVVAVSDLSLTAFKGQIFVLLGRNGGGKSTTLECISGLNKPTDGILEIDGTGGIGICPQRNVLWDELTVAEHIRLFSALKAPGAVVSNEEVTRLIKDIDLVHKTNARSKSLSGGQKRKLQLGMMLSGESQLCCVDEVSSGVDPLSRRKIWDILLKKRASRTIILTTQFLDEGDALADHIAILSRGKLLVEGSTAELKSTLGGGYRIHLHVKSAQRQAPRFHDVQQTVLPDEMVYTSSNQGQIADILAELQHQGFSDYYVSGPSIEEVFLRVVEQDLDPKELEFFQSTSGDSNERHREHGAMTQESSIPHRLSLIDGTRTTVLTQMLILLKKRLLVLLRNWLPYAAAVIMPILVAKLAMGFVQKSKLPGCAPSDIYRRSSVDFLADRSRLNMVVGPSSQLNNSSFTRLDDLLARRPGASSRSSSKTTKSVQLVDTLPEFNDYIAQHQGNLTPGAIFLPETTSPPIFAFLAQESLSHSVFAQNILNVFLSNITIHTQFSPFDTPVFPSFSAFLEFIVVLGIAIVAYPGFFALYPCFERVKQIRSLQYSNGIRPLPVWLANGIFDGVFVIFISCIVVLVLSVSSTEWYNIVYLYPVIILAGFASTALAYVTSQLMSSPLAAFAAYNVIQICFLVVYLVLYSIVRVYGPAASVDSLLLVVTYIFCTISPACNILRALAIALNVFNVDCTNNGTFRTDPASISLYGGPLFLLSLQIVLISAIVVWTELGCFWPNRRQRNPIHSDVESSEYSHGNTRFKENTPTVESKGLVVSHISKSYNSLTALEDVSLKINKEEVLALLGPNGAGKSTLISLIRGEIRPSGNSGDILVDGISVLRNRSKARARLGVCPQFDAIDQMTVLQHLKFYGQVHGLRNVNHNVHEVMRAVGIEEYASKMASKLSGGNKRKLSLAIALIGNPSLLLLDEPGSGMDAVAKRTMWRVLKSVIPGRSVLLTTHSMEEADALSVHIGIMAKRMLATGTSRELRAQHGDAYHIHCVMRSAPHTTALEVESFRAWLAMNLPEAVEERMVVDGQLHFYIPRRSNSQNNQGEGNEQRGQAGDAMVRQLDTGRLFRLLEEAKDDLGIGFYSIEETTLDQVFFRVIQRHNVEETEEEKPASRSRWWKKHKTTH